MQIKWLTASVCGAAALALAQIACGDSLSSRHFEQQKNGAQAKAQVAAAQADMAPITEIAIERSGPGPQYRAVIKADGAITYTGIKAVDRIGEFTGTISAARFRELAHYAAGIGFFHLKASYRFPMADRATVYTSVKAGAAEKIVMNYGGNGPPELKSFELKIAELLNQATLVGKEGAKGNQ